MISLTIWIFLWSSVFVVAPPSLDINHRQSLKVFSTHLSNTTAKMFMKRRKIKVNRTKTIIKQSDFDINSYRSSWKFIDKEIVAVRFRLSETLVHSIISTRFFVRHIHTGHIETFNEPNAIINSTLILYLHNLKHGRHAVCLLIYTSKQTKNPKYIFCQEIIFNYHKYGHHDMDSDEQRNTFFFLLTQYAIVIGMLCTLQLSHVIRKRRLLRTVYDKANALRNFMMEHHTHGNKPSPDLNNRTHALEYLIYNLNRNSLYNFDANNSPISIPNKKKIIKNYHNI